MIHSYRKKPNAQQEECGISLPKTRGSNPARSDRKPLLNRLRHSLSNHLFVWPQQRAMKALTRSGLTLTRVHLSGLGNWIRQLQQEQERVSPEILCFKVDRIFFSTQGREFVSGVGVGVGV